MVNKKHPRIFATLLSITMLAGMLDVMPNEALAAVNNTVDPGDRWILDETFDGTGFVGKTSSA